MKSLQNLIVGCFAAAMIATPALAQDAASDARPVKVVEVQSSDTLISWSYPAVVQPSQEAALSFRVSGRVVELRVRPPQAVKVGDVIAVLDPRDFESQIAAMESQLDQANAQLRALRSGARAEEIVALEAGVEAAQAQVDQAREQARRARELFERDLVASAALEGDEATLRVAEAELRARLEELAIGRSGGRAEEIDAAEAAIRGLQTQLETAQSNLADATLTAPFDGVIARRDIEAFANVQAGQDIVLLQNLATVNLAFDLPAPDVATFAAVGPEDISTRVSFAAVPDQSFAAELVEFSTQADASTQTYRGQVAVELPAGLRILSGMVGAVNVETQSGEAPAILVPLTAIGSAADGSSYVWIVDDTTSAVSNRPVVLGQIVGTAIQISDGLDGGETVVTAGVTRLQDGMIVRPVTTVGG